MTDPGPKHPPLTFEQKAIGYFGAALTEVFKQLPELRSVAVLFDWQGSLNNGALPFMWNNRAGRITTNDQSAIVGMAEQSCKLAKKTVEAMQMAVIALAAAAEDQAKAAASFEQARQAHPLTRLAGPTEEDIQARKEIEQKPGS